ncbi:MAG TPA: hypothetical protein VHF25_08360 [Nitriliruptorales bacterium]|nr:hypothetical protein [Nitriliruptorales bacterium]
MLMVMRVIVLVAGFWLVIFSGLAAIRTVVLPRGIPVLLTRVVFLFWRKLFRAVADRARSYHERDRAMALYAPVSLVSLPFVWLFLVAVGFWGVYWALGVRPLRQAFSLSGSSLLTLGFTDPVDLPTTVVAFFETAIGIGLAALLIAYLPSMYATFSRREAAVGLLEVRAGSPPSALELLVRFHRIEWVGRLPDLWTFWEGWFNELEETHTSLPAMVFFRSPHPDRSWITAAGAVLDAASLRASTLDLPREPEAEVCIRAGYLALRHIANFFRIPYDPDPAPDDPISVTREEFDEVVAELAEAGLPIRAGRDQAWRDFAGWRVNYDGVLLRLAALVEAPYAPWSSDRSAAPDAIRRRRR